MLENIPKRWIIPFLLLALIWACGYPGGSEPTPDAPPKSVEVDLQASASLPSATLPTQPTLPTPTPQPLPPALVEVEPLPGSRISLNQDWSFYFNQPMDKPAVESAFTIDPGVAGRFNWLDDATVTFQPDAPLPADTEIRIHLNTNTLARNNQFLPEPISLRYQTAAPFAAVDVLPQPGQTEIAPNSSVLVTFNQPVAPLGADPASQPPAFSLDPLVPGQGEWVNPSTYIFRPETALLGGIKYQVTLDSNLVSAAGAPFIGRQTFEDTPFRWAFTTAYPRLIEFRPADGAEAVRLDASFVAQFSHPMQAASVESNFSVSDASQQVVPGKLGWNADFTTLTFTPTQLLSPDSAYYISLLGAAQAQGGTPLELDHIASVKTVPGLSLRATEPADEGFKAPYVSVLLHFSGPTQAENALDFIQITPAVANLNSWWDDSERSLSLNGAFEALTAYTITVSADLPDPWGGTLGQPYSFTFQTEPLDPHFFVGNGETSLFTTPEDTAITAQLTHIDRISLRLGSLGLDEWFGFQAPGGYDALQNYRPSDQQTWTYEAGLPGDRNYARKIPITPENEDLPPGLYHLSFLIPELSYQPPPYLLVSSHVQLVFKLSTTNAFVWALDVRTNQPVVGEPVVIYDQLGNRLTSGVTDSQGVFQAPIPTQPDLYATFFAVMAEPGSDLFSLTLSNWSQGIEGYDFGIDTDFSAPALTAYIYTDRPIYRPGQIVYFRTVVRHAHNGRYALPDLETLPVTIFDAGFNPVDRFDLALSAYGTAHDQYLLPEDAQPGQYQIATDYGTVQFQVAAYRKPEIELEVTALQTDLMAGMPGTAQVQARYYFDAPAANTVLTWNLYRQPTGFDLPGYVVGSDTFRWLDPPWLRFTSRFGEQVASGRARTDADGRLSIEFATLPDSDSAYRYTLEATLNDESGFPVSARADFLVHPGGFYIGARPDSWVGQAGQAIQFEVLSVNWDQQPAPNQVLQARFQKITWQREDSTDLFGYPSFIPQTETISSADFQTAADGRAQLAFTPPEAGTYQLEIEAGPVKTQVSVWVGGNGAARWPNLPNNRLTLTADHTSYQAGDIAQIFIPNPFQAAAQALITVERDEILRYEVLTLGENGLSYALPLSAADAPNVFVAVSLVGAGADGRPDFRQGLLNLEVDPLAQALQVELLAVGPAGETRFAPRDEVTFQLRVTDAAGQPVQGEFSIALVDQAVLALADPNAPDILTAFYGSQPLGVRTGLSLAVYAHRQTDLPGGLGGGGEETAFILRENFADTAYWNAEIVTDGNGEAQISLPLPDNLTTWQVDLRGLTADTRVGQASAEIVATRDLLIRPVTPRFVVAGDHLKLAAVVHNNTLDELQVDVWLDAAGFSLDDASLQTQRVAIPAGGRVQVGWWGTVDAVAALDPIFSAAGTPGTGQILYQDASLPVMGRIPVLQFNALQSFGAAGVLDLEGERLEVVSLPARFDPAGGSLTVEMAPSLAAAMTAGFDVLEYAPYACTEQTLSRFLPNLMTYTALQASGLDSPDLLARLERTLDVGIAELVARQNEDGGWGWWSGDTDGRVASESDDYISAYVVFGLSQARDAGVFVASDVIERGANYLLATTPTLEMLSSTWQLDRLAFHYFALAQSGLGSPGMPRGLFEIRTQLSPWAKALLALTLKSYDPEDDRVAVLFSDLENEAIRTATGIHWAGNRNPVNLETPVLNTALVLYALAQYDPAGFTLPEAVRYLMAARTDNGDWGSTYQTAWALLALTEVMQGTGELAGDFGFDASLNGSPLLTGDAGGAARLTPARAEVPLSNLIAEAPNGLTLARTAGPGRLYYVAYLNLAQPVETVGPVDRGIAVTRSYHPAAASRVGDLVAVNVALTLADDAYYLLVEDYIPAGAEILDLNLKTSQIGVAEIDYGLPFSVEDGWGWWLFNDPQVYDDRIAWTADYMPAGTYELTYTLVLNQPGTFQVIPAQARMFYFPEVRGSSAGEVFVIED